MSELLEDLLMKAQIYRWFYIPEKCDNPVISRVLQFFKDNNHRQFRPIFLSVIAASTRKEIDIATTEKFFVFVQNFYLAYGLVCGSKSNVLDDFISNQANLIENGDAEDGIINFIKKLKTYYPPYPQFLAAFKILGYSQKVKFYKTPAKKHDIQYIWRRFENFWLTTNRELNVAQFTIEHIGCDDGTETHCRIGNLLPLAESVNNKIGNISFSEKVSWYKKSNFVTVKRFVDRYGNKAEWKEEDIDKRAAHMAELAYNSIWSISNIFPEVQ